MAYYPGTCIFLPWFDWSKVGDIPVGTVRKFDQFSTYDGVGTDYPQNEGQKVQRLKDAGKRVFGTLGANAPDDWKMPNDRFRALIRRYIENVDTRTVEVGNEVGMAVDEFYFPKLRIAAEELHADGRRVNMTSPYPSVTMQFLEAAKAVNAFDVVDAVCIHVYTGSPETSLSTVRNVRAKLDAWGVEKPINITEFGWATDGDRDGPARNLIVTETQQRDYLARAFANWEMNAEELNLANCLWYSYNDWSTVQGATTPPKHWINNCGVVRIDGSRKPSYAALKSVAA